MGKITDKDYSLPIIEALTPIESFDTGANRPLLIRGVDSGGVKDDYVVKFRAAERMSAEACMRELLAAFIAAQMEILAVKPVVVNISQAFADLLRGTDSWKYATTSLGYNYGSEYIKKHTTIVPTGDLSSTQLYAAQTIFSFDLLIQNPDRTKEKPNMLTDGSEIVIYDHELAFSFLFDFNPNPKPWELRDSDINWIGRHCLLPKIKGKEYDFEGFSARFNNLDEEFWTIARKLIPTEWYSGQFDKIKQYFSAICNNKGTFIKELKQLMS